MIARHGRRYIADKRGHRSIHTAAAAGDPGALREFDARVAEYNRANMGDAERAAIAIFVAAQFYDGKSVAEYCKAWNVMVSWIDRPVVNGRTARQLRITVERDGETGVYEPLCPKAIQESVEETILGNGGSHG